MWFSGHKTHILDKALQDIKSASHDSHSLFQSYVPAENNSGNRTRKSTKRSEVSVSENEVLGYIRSPYFKKSCGIVQQPACEVLVQNMITKGEIQFSRCPEPCQYQEWEAVVASSPFPPTKHYFNKFLKNEKLQEFDEARESIARLHVYYDDIKIDKEDQVPSYKPHNFVAEFGGTVDLFIGFSFFTVVQLIEICIAACYFRYKNFNKKDDTD